VLDGCPGRLPGPRWLGGGPWLVADLAETGGVEACPCFGGVAPCPERRAWQRPSESGPSQGPAAGCGPSGDDL